MISKMMRGSIKSRVFSALLVPIVLIEIFIFTGYYAYITKVNKLRYEKIAETISVPFISALEKKLVSFNKIEDRKDFLGIYADLKGSIDFDIWQKQYKSISGVSFVDNSSFVLSDAGGVENFGHLNIREIRTTVSSRIKGHFTVAVPLLVDNYYYGALNFWFPDEEAAAAENIAFISSLIVLAVSMVSGAFLAWWMSMSITRPINLLAAESTRIAAGELDHDISYLASEDEIGLLAKNFSQMRYSIREKISALEDSNLKLINEINERKNAEKELQKHRDKLEVIVRERTLNLIDVNKALTESKTFLNVLLNAIPLPVYYKDRAGKYVGFNRSFETFFGQKKERLIGKTVFDINPQKFAELYHAKDLELFENGGIQEYEAQVQNSSGQLRDVVFYKAVYNDNEGGIRGLIGTILDITDRKHIEDVLRKNEERLRLLTESSVEVLYHLNLDGIIKYMSPAVERISAYPLDEVLNRGYENFFPESERGKLKEAINKSIVRDNYQLVESIAIRKDDSNYPIEISISPIKKDEEIIGVQGIARDITERKKMEKQQKMLIGELKKALEEKEVLLREIHHRVKNNMQIVSSLLTLQRNKLNDPETISAFLEAEDRVHSMALVHEILYHSESLADLDFQEYLEKLVRHISEIFHPNKNININIDAKNILLTMEQAITCGLIATELISNSMKYAFKDNQAGEIKVTVLQCNPGEFEMCISDNGKGLEKEFEWETSKTLGLRLVRQLALDQLEGSLNLIEGTGACWAIGWKKN